MCLFFKRILIFSILALFAACGSGGGPFEMATSTTVAIGNADVAPVQFIVDPVEESGEGVLTALVDEDFFNRRTYIVQDFNIDLEFPGIGPVNFRLNPNFESTATIFRLNADNQPFGTHTMTLFLIVETPDQNLTYDNVLLASDTATLSLMDPLPTLSFLLDGTQKLIQTLALQVVIPAELITSREDPN